MQISISLLIFRFIMALKMFLMLGLVLLAQGYTEENHVLVLTDEDLPGVISEFPYILIEFYAPWCGHCKKLTPIYDEVAKELHDSGSPVRLAKINADEYSSVKGGFQVQGFPTLLFFNNGQQIKYSGQRTKEVMISWLSKKTRPAVTVLEADKLDQLSNEKVNVLLHTNDAAEHDQAFIELANTDDYNSYFSVKGSSQPAGTVQIFRPFGKTQSTTVSESLKEWISKNDRPVVVAFDDRTIGSIFADRGVGVILFHSKQAGEVLSSAFNDAAQEIRIVKEKSSVIFTDIQSEAEHHKGLANYIKVITEKSPVIIIDGGKRMKYVLEGQAADLTADQIVVFVEDFLNGKAKEYKLDEEVTYSDSSKVEEEL